MLHTCPNHEQRVRGKHTFSGIEIYALKAVFKFLIYKIGNTLACISCPIFNFFSFFIQYIQYISLFFSIKNILNNLQYKYFINFYMVLFQYHFVSENLYSSVLG